jgi:hypothetical protein
MALRGRHFLAGWLIFLLAILAWVTARNTAAHVLARELAELREERSAREAERAELLRRIREGSSLGTLRPLAEELGLRLPADSQVIILQQPVREPR